MNGWTYYQTADLALVPYMPGTPVWKDGVLSTLYYNTRDEDKLAVTFCGDVMNHDQFVAFFQKRQTLVCLCEVREDKTLNIVGYAWVDTPTGVDGARAVLCGFCFFKGASKRTSARDLGRLGLAYWFLDMLIDVVHGIMLESNVRGRNYAQHLGFHQVGIIPKRHYYEGELVGARVMMLEKTDFVPMFEEWFESQKAVAVGD
jgi:RimJ/RimL family protein N-acetyltransferase